MKHLEITLRFALILTISILIYHNCLIFAQDNAKIITRSFPLAFNESFQGNKLWLNPVNIVDGDLDTFSAPLDFLKYDDEGSFYLLHLQRPITPSGELIDNKDYGTIVKVQIKLDYSLFEGTKFSRFSYVEVEGYVIRLTNVDVAGAGLEEKIADTIDVTKAVKQWSFTNPQQWDEIILQFSSDRGILSEELFNLFEIQLLVTYIQK